MSRPPARTRGLKPADKWQQNHNDVASSREDAWIETNLAEMFNSMAGRVLPRGRVD